MKSMTGFGSAIRESAEYQLEIEIKSVNQRFLDIQMRGPKALGFVENELRQLIKKKLSRGRVDVFMNLTYLGTKEQKVSINWNLIDTLYTQLTEGIEQKYGQSNQLSLGALIERFALDEAFVTIEETKQENQDALAKIAVETMQSALSAIETSREVEGQALADVLKQQAKELEGIVDSLHSFVNVYEEEYRLKFQEKLEEFLGTDVDEQRLLTELAILLERGDIHEELDRLTIHGQKLEELLTVKYPIGRELDFLVQEMNREINTIGSKSSAIEIKNQVIQAKTILEKIREQIKNIE